MMASLNYKHKISPLSGTNFGLQQYSTLDSVSMICPQTPNGKEDYIFLFKPQADGERKVMLEKICDLEFDKEINSDDAQMQDDNLINWRTPDDLPKDFTKIPFGQGLGEGERLVEIFTVSIHSNIKHARKMSIHGIITIYSTYGASEIFGRTHKCPERIRPQDNLTLTGPVIANVADDYFSIKLDVKDGGREVSKGVLHWDMYSMYRDPLFDQTLIRKVKGKNGYARIAYAIFQDAMLISVEIKFSGTICRRSPQAMIYGSIYASIVGMSSLKTTLFSKKHNNYAIIDEEGVLPLSKSLIALPMGRSIEISLHLVENRSLGSSSKVVTDDLQLCPKCFGDHEKTVQSKYGTICVKITAYPPIFHPNTSVAREITMSELYDIDSNELYSVVSDSE